MATKTRSDFKKAVLDFQMMCFTADPMPDPKQLGVFLLTRIIPAMDGSDGFYFFWNGKDIVCQSQEDYDKSIALADFKRTFPKKTLGDTEWEYVFTSKGKKRRCVMTTEIHFHPKKRQPLSPTALLFGQMFGNGLHITKCRFEDAE